MEAGLNLFSIRNLLTTPEDYMKTVWALKEMGYTSLQHSGAGYDPDLLSRVVRETGLPIVLTHVKADRILGETEALMAEHAKFGCYHIGLGAMPREAMFDDEACKNMVASLDAAGARMEKNGFRFFYHHHHYEFRRMANGQTILDYMIENAPHINFTLDTYWVQYGGAAILETIDKLNGRIACAHLKDYKIVRDPDDEKKMKPLFAPVGEGNINFPAVVAKMRTCGVKHFLVEQDNAALLPDPLGEVKRSIEYIKTQL